MTSVTIGPDDGVPDVAALINAALADPAITNVILGEGLFLLHSPIVVPSGKTLSGAGRDLTILRAAEDFDRVNPGEGDGVVNSEVGAVGITLTDFSIDANKLTPDGFRMVGCFMKSATDFTIARVDVYNTSGYGHYAGGDANSFTSYASGTYDDCGAFNCQIAFEQMACDGITLTNCVAGDGDGDLVGTYFHPLTGSKNISYINCRATGFGDVGFELTGNVRPLENIRIIDCQVEMLGGGAALVAAGAFQTFGLHLEGSSFVSHGNIAALLYGVIGTAQDCYFQGDTIGIAFFHSSDGFASDYFVSDSHVLGLRHPYIGAAYGISTSGGTIVWEGGSIEARGASVNSTSGPVTVSPTTIVTLEIYDSRVSYVENGDAILLAPALVLDGLPPGTLDGGSLTVAFEANGSPGDQLGILNQGIGVGQIGLSGADVTFGGAVIGTWSGGANGEDLVISLSSGATAAAVAALAQAITFVSLTDNPRDYRAVELVIADALGASVETNVAIGVEAINDAPAISSGPPGSAAILDYAEGGGPAAIAPALTLSDVDSLNFDGGSLTIQFTENGDADDRLSILSQGNGLGQIGVSGNVVSYGGVAIGTFSGGEDGASPLVVSLNVDARPASVEALARSVAYLNVSFNPSEALRMVSFTVDDGDGGTGLASAMAAILFEGIEYPAMARNDEVAADAELGIIAASIFADNGHGEDWDPDGPDLIVSEVNGVAADVGAEVMLASGAKLVLRADGTFDYDPNGMFDSLAAAGTGAVNSFATDSFTYALAGGDGATVTIIVHGVASPGDRLEGDGGDNRIIGTAEADYFFLEQGGEDDIDGGGGDDTIYYGAAWSASDRTAGGDGTDAVVVSGSFDLTLSAASLVAIERLVLESGSALPDAVPHLYSIRTDDANLASGAELRIEAGQLQADEALLFDASAETDGRFVVESGLGDDVITLGGGDDLVRSGGGNDRIDGGSGDDLIDGGAGADAMAGGAGDDVYVVDDSADIVTEVDGAGVDEVRTSLGSNAPPDRALYALPDFVENLTGTSAGNQAVRDNALNNVITMGGGHDLIVADAGGVDTISGGAGNDFIYHGDKLTADDITDGGAGTDTIALMGDYGGGIIFTATNLVGVERLAVFSSLFVPGTGPSSYVVTMNDANVASGTEFFVTAASLQSGESLVFDGSAETDGRFTIHGGAGGDALAGGAGEDFLIGNAGDDLIYGLAGIDYLLGGMGADQLSGGAGADIFAYRSGAESAAGSSDRILDFRHIDRIDLAAIDADVFAAGNQAFAFIGAAAFSGTAGELRAFADAGLWFVEGDLDGDGVADMVIEVVLIDPAPLTAAEFIL